MPVPSMTQQKRKAKNLSFNRPNTSESRRPRSGATIKYIKEGRKRRQATRHTCPRAHIFSTDLAVIPSYHHHCSEVAVPSTPHNQTASSNTHPVTPFKIGVHCTRRSQATKKWHGLCQSGGRCENASGLSHAFLRCSHPWIHQRPGQPGYS